MCTQAIQAEEQFIAKRKMTFLLFSSFLVYSHVIIGEKSSLHVLSITHFMLPHTDMAVRVKDLLVSKCRSAICMRKYRRSDKYWEFILMNKNRYTHAHKHTHFKSKVLGSRLSRPGSPLAALSQLRSTERVGWEGWVTEVERVGGGRTRWRNLPGDICHSEQLVSCFFAARSVTHGFSCMTDQELWEF